ncbi:5'-nucleotidase [Microthyrium microscopicum]|uniref:5'-nucleotidase n=1 Tax=Microthyrium microscopicum TaxID=703497 RepID=A0A6A6UQ48_9PEZI|nr:5'-nucleotidase [Microthyrium microscopicum]
MPPLAEGESITFESPSLPDSLPDLRLLHYNDVYHVDSSSSEPVGGISRFQTLINYYRHDPKFKGQPDLLTFFSGDAFNPSLESTITKGAHMVQILNDIGTDVACIGNHDLDFGVPQFQNLASKCKFPWLLANILDKSLGDNVPLGNALPTKMLTSSNGIRLGVIGLGEREWLATVNSLPPNLEYRSVSETAKKLVPELKSQGADIIIALTHQREPNDNKLAQKTGSDVLDIVLGGHDHFYSHNCINGVQVLRSGTDFKQLSYIECWRNSEGKAWKLRVTRRDVVSSIQEDATALSNVGKLTKTLKARLEQPIGYTLAPLDARFVTVRTKESNMGNFVCDLMRYYYDSDACIMASGTIRGDQIYPPGIIKMKDIMNCFPFEDPVVVIMVTGEQLLLALQNSVSQHPALEGRFPQVSNITFTFDPSKPVESRIMDVSVAGEPLDPKRRYKLTTRDYMARGKDGFESLMVPPEDQIVNEENGVLISTILRQYFMSLKVLGRWKMFSTEHLKHWDNVNQGLIQSSCAVVEPPKQSSGRSGAVEAARRAIQKTGIYQSSETSSAEDLSGYDSEGYASEKDLKNEKLGSSGERREQKLMLARKVVRKWRRLAGLVEHSETCDSLDESEMSIDWTKAIAPRLEGRIKIVESAKATA